MPGGLSEKMSLGSAASPTGAPVSVLLAPLKELAEAVTLQQEALREMVAAVADADRGKMGALNAFLQEPHRLRGGVGREEGDRLRAEVRGRGGRGGREGEDGRCCRGRVAP